METKKSLKEFSSGADARLIEKIKDRNANKKQLRTYKRIALDILLKLDEPGWSQKRLAEELDVSAQYVNKLVKGNEKFGGDILCKLEEILDLPIFVQNLPRETKKLVLQQKNQELTNVKTYKAIVIPMVFASQIPNYAQM